PGLSRDFQDEAVGKAESWALSEILDRRSYHIGVLYGQALVVEEHFGRRGDLLYRPGMHRIEHPSRFRQDQVRYPPATGYELLGCAGLFRIVAYDQTHQYLRVNGAHAACG